MEVLLIIYNYTSIIKALLIFNRYVNEELNDKKLVCFGDHHMVAGYFNAYRKTYSDADTSELFDLGWRPCCCQSYWVYCPKECNREKCNQISINYRFYNGV